VTDFTPTAALPLSVPYSRAGNLVSGEDTYTMIADVSCDEIPQVARCEEGSLEHHRLRGIVLAFAGNR